ncbi:MAG: glycosyltransferase [Maricaulaceae bacterium]|jgi:glycosyltransferase involved in cell wall biosynthesis
MNRQTKNRPRLLLLDQTPITGSAATSALKHALLGDWPADALLQVLMMGKAPALAAATGRPRPIAARGDLAEALLEFYQPEVILYRPVAEYPHFGRLAMDLIASTTAPVVIWMMDDWPARLLQRGSEAHAAADRDLKTLFQRARASFVISDAMAEAFRERYGVEFKIAHGGITPTEWPKRKQPDDGVVRVRYAGSLAPDTTQDSVFAVAHAVSRVAEAGRRVAFEARSQTQWLADHQDRFNALPGVRLAAADLTAEEYRQWLSDADVVLVAYNFDETTRTYLRYSLANKTAEALASGAAVLAYGPSDIETISILKDSRAAVVIDAPSADRLEAALCALIDDPERRQAMGATGRRLAAERFDLSVQREALVDALCQAARPTEPLSGEEPHARSAGARAAVKAFRTRTSAYRATADWLHDNFPHLAKLLHGPAVRVKAILRKK